LPQDAADRFDFRRRACGRLAPFQGAWALLHSTTGGVGLTAETAG